MSSPRTKHIYDDYRWKALRRAAIRRSNGQCELQLPGCTRIATQGDHTIALEDGGAPFDAFNVKASCRHCNVAKENDRRLARGNDQPLRTSRAW